MAGMGTPSRPHPQPPPPRGEGAKSGSPSPLGGGGWGVGSKTDSIRNPDDATISELVSSPNLPVHTMRTIALCLALLALASGSSLTAADAAKPIPPKEAAGKMTLPDGFKVTLFAGEP